MAADQPNSGRAPAADGKVGHAQAEQKARGANRSTKVAGKLKVLPDQPDVPSQSQILAEAPKTPPPAAAERELKSGGTGDSDEEDGDDEEEPEDGEEPDAEVSVAMRDEGICRS